jgi:hypothetical protein
MLVHVILHDIIEHVIELDTTGSFNWPLSAFKKLIEIRFKMGLNIRMIMAENPVIAYWKTLLYNLDWKSSKRLGPNGVRALSSQISSHYSIFSNEQPYTGPSKELIEHATKINHHYKLIVSQGGYIGLAPLTTNIGDSTCVLSAGQVPFILRLVDLPSTQFEMIGPAYVHGVMDGEAVDLASKTGSLRTLQTWFNIT